MDWNSINWEWIGMVAVLAIMVGGFVGGAVFILTRWADARRDRRHRSELNSKPVFIEEYDWALVDGKLQRVPRQRGGEDS